MSLSVVTVTYNSADCVTACLRAIADRLPQAERIVVDNDSSDQTLALVRAEAPGTVVVAGGGNLGFGHACNLGVRSASHRHVLLLNPDVVITHADARELESLFDLPELGLVVPLLAPAPGQAGHNHVRPQRHWVPEALDHALGPLRPRALGPSRPRQARGDDGWASGAMLLVRREEFERAGGFNPDLFLYYEDRDLSGRYRRAGLPLRPTDALAGVHAGGASSAPADGGADRMAYSFLGFVEYLHAWRGERTARRAARLTLSASGAAEAALAAAAAALPRVGKLRAKHEQVAAFRAFARGTRPLRLPDGDRAYPNARRLLAALGGRHGHSAGGSISDHARGDRHHQRDEHQAGHVEERGERG